MPFYLQQGHGMRSLQVEFVAQFPGTSVIMSPRCCTPDQAKRHAREISKAGGRVLFDPQFYDPHTPSERILTYPYWITCAEGFSTQDFQQDCVEDLCSRVVEYQTSELNVGEVILPGRYTNSPTENWLETQSAIANSVAAQHVGVPVYSTLALGPDVIAASENLDATIDEAIAWPTDGVYVVFRHPNSDRFLIADDLFLYNLLSALLSLQRAGKKVVLGYANQQMLIAAVVGIHGPATGNFRNVRQFNPDMFRPDEGESWSRAVWYYDSTGLSEFRTHAIALAYRRGMSGLFTSGSPFDEPLLSDPNPTSVRWGEREAFRHYLFCMRRQWTNLQSYRMCDRVNAVLDMLDGARRRMDALRERGFPLGERSFLSALEPSESAVNAIAHDRAYDLAAYQGRL